MEQGSDEWLAARVGKVTASRIADLTSKTKSGAVSASRGNYQAEIIAERLSGRPYEGFITKEMQWGTEHEEEAVEAFSFITGIQAEKAGFVLHPTIEMAGASPDRIIGDDGLIEIKCPNTATHLSYMEFDKIPENYHKQMQFQMACTGRQYCHFVSYDPRIDFSFFTKLVTRDEKLIAETDADVVKFLSEVDERIEKMRKRYG